MLKIYATDDETIVIEEDGNIIDEIDTEHQDVSFVMTDDTAFLFEYSVKKNKVWTIEMQNEGFEQYDIEEHDEKCSEYPSDIIEIDSEVESYSLVQKLLFHFYSYILYTIKVVN